MHAIAPFLLTLVITGPSSASRGATALELTDCQVTAIREVQIPARQPGVLQDILVDEGVMVEEAQQVAQIDDQESNLRLIAALREAEAAAEQAKEPVDVEAAKAAYSVAEAEVAMQEGVNERLPNTVSLFELRRARLTADRSRLQIKVAEMEFAVATKTAAAKGAMADVAEYDIASRKLVAPFDGLVVEKFRQAGEWVQAGDPVVRIVQMDRLRVQGRLSAEHFAPQEIEGRRVKIIVQLPGGQQHEVQGVVGYVSQVVELSDTYRVWAEFENVPVETRENRTFWLMRPGMPASMVIDMSGN